MGGVTVSDKITYQSSLSKYITDFINEKRSLGYKYNTQEILLKSFDTYWFSHCYPCQGITRESINDWITKKDSEGAGGLHGRISVVREFSKYLNGIGIPSFIPMCETKYHAPLPHIFTAEELRSLFNEIDTDTTNNNTNYSKRIANECPVLFRLIYLHGLRISEACYLSVSEVDLSNKKIMILDGKGSKDRMIYLSSDMSELCKEYLHYLKKVLGTSPDWMFPGMTPDKPITAASAEVRFHKAWKRTEYAANCSIEPTVHDFRHTYVVNRINSWIEQGIDFEQMLPYLSKFLGHKSFEETSYYYHYIEEAAKIIQSRDKSVKRVIPEVMRR